MTRSDLLDVVYRFYPRGLLAFGVGYDDTEELQRQRDAARRGADAYPTWKAMIRRLATGYSMMDRSVRILGGGRDPAYSADIEIPRFHHRLPRLLARALLRDPSHGPPRRGAGGPRSRPRDRSHLPRIRADPARDRGGGCPRREPGREALWRGHDLRLPPLAGVGMDLGTVAAAEAPRPPRPAPVARPPGRDSPSCSPHRPTATLGGRRRPRCHEQGRAERASESSRTAL